MTDRDLATPGIEPLLGLAQDLHHDAARLAHATSAAGRRWRLIHYWLGGPAAVAAAIAGASAIQSDAALAAVFALVSAALTSLITWLNPGSMAGSFLQTSRQYAKLCWRLVDLQYEVETASGERQRKLAKTRLSELAEELHRVRDGSPDVPQWAFRAKAIQPRRFLRRMELSDVGSELLRGLGD